MPASSTIRMSQINTELGRSSTASISLDTAENGGYGAINQASASRPSSNNPASLSEWYSYNHNAIVLQYTHTLYYASGDNNGRFGFTTSSAACSSTSPSITVYSNSSTITPGMGLYYDQYGNSLVWSSSYNSTNPYFKLNSSLIRLQQNDLEIQVGYAVYDVSSCVAPSVVFNNTYYWSYTSFGQGASGTVIITGSPATFKARGVVINSGSAVVTNITIGGISRSTSRFSTPGTNDSTTFTLSPGTYSYSVTISLPQAGAIGGGIVFTQP
jgi:hypothetical protein